MRTTPNKLKAFTLVEILLVTAVIGIISGLGIVAVTGVRENARETRLRNDVTVLNNGIDAYRAAGGVLPSGLTAEQVIAKLKTVADPASSTAFGPSGPFIDPRLQLLRQSSEDGAMPEARADYPNAAGYFFVRQGGAPAIKEFIRGEASPIVTEVRQGTMPYTPAGGFLTAYGEQPAATPIAAAAPAAVAGTDAAANTGKDLVKFPRPRIKVRTAGTSDPFVDYAGESLPLLKYPLEVMVVSDIETGGAQLQCALGGGSFFDCANPYTIQEADPGMTLVARVASLDTSRYSTSDPVSVRFRAEPVSVFPVFPTSDAIPETMTYAEAGGAMVGLTPVVREPVVVRLENIELVPAKYRTSSYLDAFFRKTTVARYTGVTTVETNSGFAAPTFTPVTNNINVAGFGSNTRMSFFARVESFQPEFVVAADDLDKTTTIQPTLLPVAILPLKPIGLPPNVTIAHSGDVPVGMRKFYTLTQGQSSSAPLNPEAGGVPIASAVLYNAPITNYPIATYTVVAQATGPVGTEHWFTSSPVNRTYIAVTQVPLKYIGLNMFRANINGYVKGSIYMQAGDFAVLNAGATIEGNVYLPGTPAVFLPASGALVVRRGQAYDQSKDALISSNRITGREYDQEGRLADPQQDLRKVVDLYGSTQPSNYEFRGTETSRIDGKLYRRADPPPVTSQKPGLPPEIALSNAPVTVAGTQFIDSGSYAVTLNNTNSVLQLGSPGNLTKYVFGAGSTWSAGRVEILGPVQIFFNSNVSMSGMTFGSSNSIFQTGFVVMSNYSVSIGSGGTVYGQFEARDSVLSVGNGGSFYGSAFAREVSVAGGGYVDVSAGSEPPSTP
jgi:type II secretory pathway pseudopilin PulG